MFRLTVTGTGAAALLIAVTMVLTACGGSGHAGSTASVAPEISTDPLRQDTFTDGVPAEIRARGELVIGTNAPYAPLEFFDEDDKTLIGFDIDLGNAIGRSLGLEVTWKNVAFDTILPGLESGRYDMGIAGFGIERERLKTVDFVSYYLNGGGYLVKAGSGIRLHDYGTALCGLRVAVQTATDFVSDLEKAKKRCARQGKEPLTILRIADQKAVVLAVTGNRADAGLADKPQVEWAAAKSNGQLCVTGTFRTTSSLAGIAVPKKTPGLTEAVHGAVAKLIQGGEYDEIAKKWGVVEGAVRTSMVFTLPEQVGQSGEIFPDRYSSNCA